MKHIYPVAINYIALYQHYYIVFDIPELSCIAELDLNIDNIDIGLTMTIK